MIIKFLFFIGWIGIAILSIIGILTSIIPLYSEVIDFHNLIFRASLFIGSLFYFLLFVEKLVGIFIKDDKAYEFKGDKGFVKVSSSSVNNLIKSIVESNPNVKNVKVLSSQGKKGIKINLKLDINTLPNLTSEYSKIQEIIEHELKEKLNIDVEKIDIITNKLLHTSKGNYPVEKVKIEEVKIQEIDSKKTNITKNGDMNE